MGKFRFFVRKLWPRNFSSCRKERKENFKSNTRDVEVIPPMRFFHIKDNGVGNFRHMYRLRAWGISPYVSQNDLSKAALIEKMKMNIFLLLLFGSSRHLAYARKRKAFTYDENRKKDFGFFVPLSLILNFSRKYLFINP